MTVKVHPMMETVAKKLFGINTVEDNKDRVRMVRAAAKEASDLYDEILRTRLTFHIVAEKLPRYGVPVLVWRRGIPITADTTLGCVSGVWEFTPAQLVNGLPTAELPVHRTDFWLFTEDARTDCWTPRPEDIWCVRSDLRRAAEQQIRAGIAK